MYKKKLFFLIFSMPLFIFAQEINKLDAQGKRHGFWEKRYDSGRVRYSGTFNHGKETGEFLFYENKIINNYPTIKKVFDDHSDKALVVFYDLYGKKKSEGSMLGKKRVGTWKYYNPQGKLILTENYENNLLQGKRTVFYTNDSIAELSEYKNGKLDGVTTRFSKDGIKLHEMSYQEGLLHGRTKFYEVNGDLKETGLYYKDYKVGKWDFYIDGKYMGFKEPNKKTKGPSDKAIMQSVNSKKDTLRVYSKPTDAEIMDNIAHKKVDNYVDEKPSDKEILESIERKKVETKTYSKVSDDEILRSIAAKMDKKIKKREPLEDDEILKNIQRKKEKERKEKMKKLTWKVLTVKKIP